MGDIDRVSKVPTGRFNSDPERLQRVAPKDENPKDSSKDQGHPQEHPDQVELHTFPTPNSPDQTSDKQKDAQKRRLTQQNHLDIEA